MPASTKRFASGAVLASTVALAARRKHWLTRGGAIAASLVGSAVYAGTGIRGSRAMLAFFASSSLLSHLPSAAPVTQRRGNARDAIQVLANGGAPAALALSALRAPLAIRPIFFTGFGGAVAAAAADTWATEIGTRYGRDPRSLLTFQPMSAGASGAITLAGLLASAAGAALIAALVAPPTIAHVPRQAMAIALGGIIGSLVDSYFGAAWQEVRYCQACQITTESPIHSCGTRTMHLRGLAWCNNDVVNALAVVSGALVAISLDAIPTRDTFAPA